MTRLFIAGQHSLIKRQIIVDQPILESNSHTICTNLVQSAEFCRTTTTFLTATTENGLIHPRLVERKISARF